MNWLVKHVHSSTNLTLGHWLDMKDDVSIFFYALPLLGFSFFNWCKIKSGLSQLSWGMNWVKTRNVSAVQDTTCALFHFVQPAVNRLKGSCAAVTDSPVHSGLDLCFCEGHPITFFKRHQRNHKAIANMLYDKMFIRGPTEKTGHYIFEIMSHITTSHATCNSYITCNYIFNKYTKCCTRADPELRCISVWSPQGHTLNKILNWV